MSMLGWPPPSLPPVHVFPTIICTVLNSILCDILFTKNYTVLYTILYTTVLHYTTVLKREVQWLAELACSLRNTLFSAPCKLYWPLCCTLWCTMNFKLCSGMSGNDFLHFGNGTGKSKKLSRWLGQEREIKETIPIVWDGIGKNEKPFP